MTSRSELRVEFDKCAREWLGVWNEPAEPLTSLIQGTPLEHVDREFWVNEWAARGKVEKTMAG